MSEHPENTSLVLRFLAVPSGDREMSSDVRGKLESEPGRYLVIKDIITLVLGFSFQKIAKGEFIFQKILQRHTFGQKHSIFVSKQELFIHLLGSKN